jgi:hypothetical protein
MRFIRVVNQSRTVADAEFEAAVRAAQRQLTEHFAPAWGGLCAALTLVKGAPGVADRPATETIYVLDDSDQAGALGYHELVNDVPVGLVFAHTAARDRQAWTVTLSHELLEQLADPYCATCAVVPMWGGRMYAVEYEVCDPVEQDAYLIDDVPVSNFVLPSWFQPRPGAVGPFDHLGRLKAPLTLRPGGYIGYSADLNNWEQTFGAREQPHYHRTGKRAYQGRGA